MKVKLPPFQYPIRFCLRKDSVVTSNGHHISLTKAYATKIKPKVRRRK